MTEWLKRYESACDMCMVNYGDPTPSIAIAGTIKERGIELSNAEAARAIEKEEGERHKAHTFLKHSTHPKAKACIVDSKNDCVKTKRKNAFPETLQAARSSLDQ